MLIRNHSERGDVGVVVLDSPLATVYGRPLIPLPGDTLRVHMSQFFVARRVHQGDTVDFLLRPDRGIAAAQAFFHKARESNADRFPRKVKLDGHVPSRMALWRLLREHVNWRHVKVRTSQYLNNIVEQDHRGIKALLRPTKGLKSFATAAITIAGFELAHRIRKRQFNFRRRGHRYARSRQIDWQIALA